MFISFILKFFFVNCCSPAMLRKADRPIVFFLCDVCVCVSVETEIKPLNDIVIRIQCHMTSTFDRESCFRIFDAKITYRPNLVTRQIFVWFKNADFLRWCICRSNISWPLTMIATIDAPATGVVSLFLVIARFVWFAVNTKLDARYSTKSVCYAFRIWANKQKTFDAKMCIGHWAQGADDDDCYRMV